MRIFEIADAEAQLALWKLVNDSVWTAIQTQQHEEAKQKAAAQQQKKAKRSKRVGKRIASVPAPIPKIPKPAPKLATPTKTKPPSPPPPLKPNPKATNPQPTSQPNSALPTSQQSLSPLYNGAVSRLNNASFGIKPHTFGGDNGV
jgi:hypothetical protein